MYRLRADALIPIDFIPINGLVCAACQVRTIPIFHTVQPMTVDAPAESRRTSRVRSPFAMLRSTLFWSHLAMGTLGGVIILVMSVTGALLGFEKQLVARFDGVPKVVAPAGALRMPLDSLFAVAHLDAAAVASVALKANPTEPISVRFRDKDTPAALLDPYRGDAVAPVPRGKMAASMSWLRSWHRWLGAEGEQRVLMRKLTGISNIAFLLLVLSGLYLWWPRSLSRTAIRTAAVFNPRLRGKPRDFNWHNSLGFWCAIPLAFVVATGVFISYSWPGQWMDRLWGSPRERVAAVKAMNGAPKSAGASPEVAWETEAPVAVSLDAMLRTVQTARPAWTSITITTAAPRDSVVQLAVAEGNTFRPDLKWQYFFDAATGQPTRMTNFASLSTSRRIRGWTRFGHTGEIFGLTGQAIATFVSFVGALLVYTGLALAWRRLLAFVRRRRRFA